MNIHLISAILKNIWAIDPDAALSYAPLLNNLIGTGMKLEVEFKGQEFQPFAIHIGGRIEINPNKDRYEDQWFDNMQKLPEGSIVTIPLNGPLMKQDQYCGPVGMAAMGKVILAADKATNVAAIILSIDSPGGTVDGTMDLAEIVANTSKPIIAFADGLMASAAMWIGSAADEIIASNNKAQVGSIGVMMSFADVQPAYEAIGVKFHSIVAEQSKDKNALFEAVRAGKYDDYRKEVLNPLAADFIAAIKQNRPGVKDDQLTGRVFFAESVIGSLVDSVGNFDYAVQRASELAAQHKKEISIKSKNPTSMKKQYANVNKLLEVDQLEAQEEGVFLNEDQVSAIDTALANGTQAATDLQTATAAKEKAESDLAAAQQSIQEKDAEIAQLKKTAGAEPAKVISEKETASNGEKDSNVVSEEKSFEENLDVIRKEFF